MNYGTGQNLRQNPNPLVPEDQGTGRDQTETDEINKPDGPERSQAAFTTRIELELPWNISLDDAAFWPITTEKLPALHPELHKDDAEPKPDRLETWRHTPLGQEMYVEHFV